MGISLLFLATTGIPSLGAGDPNSITADTQIDKPSITLGDIVTYTVRVTHDPKIQVEAPEPKEHFSGFDFLDLETGSRKKPSGQVIEEFRYRFRAAKVGYYNIPEIPVIFHAPNPDNLSQKIPGQIMAPAVIVEIRSVLYLDGEPTDIREIKPIIGAGLPWRTYLQHAFLFALLFGLVFYLFKRFARPKKYPVAKPVSSTPPHEQALRELEALAARKLIENGRLREHHFELSEIFRRYIGKRYSVPALDWTTEEIMDKLLQQSRFQSHVRNQAATVLQNMDWVKFSKYEGDVKACIYDTQAVREFVESTLPAHDIQSSQKSPTAPI